MASVEKWEFESLERFYKARRERRYSPEATEHDRQDSLNVLRKSRCPQKDATRRKQWHQMPAGGT